MNITRPTVTENYTTLPNELFDFGRSIHHSNVKLKPRDSSVLNYLLSKPPHWKIIAADIAKAVNISLNTVYRALTVLQKLGVVSYTRDKFGYTRWLVSVSQTLYRPVTAPHNQKPRVENECDLINNESLEKNKTTTSCVSFEEKSLDIDLVNTTESNEIVVETRNQLIKEIELPLELVSHLSEIEQVLAKKTIRKSQVDNSTYNLILMALKLALSTGNVRSPIAYLNSLISKAKNGSLHVHNSNNANSSNKSFRQREQVIKDLVVRYGDQMLSDIVYRGFISNETLGYVTYLELKDMGLISHYWSKKYDDYQIDKLNQLAMSCSNTPISTRSDKKEITKSKQRLSESEFESKRSEKIARALELANQLNS
jgi:hypothetical protein